MKQMRNAECGMLNEVRASRAFRGYDVARSLSSFSIPHSAFRIPRPRRGTAEIELILSVAVLMTIMFLALGAMRLAAARLSTARTANVEAFRNATVESTPMYTGDPGLPPVDGIGAVRPGLPNRTH